MTFTADEYKAQVDMLETKYPKMFAKKYGGLAIGAGWWNMINELCNTIQKHIDNNPNCPQVVIEQIKEKFGGLRFYYQGGDEFIHGAVWFAETMSTTLCEECGAPGHRTNGGYIQTLCKKHRDEKEQAKLLKEGYEQ